MKPAFVDLNITWSMLNNKKVTTTGNTPVANVPIRLDQTSDEISSNHNQNAYIRRDISTYFRDSKLLSMAFARSFVALRRQLTARGTLLTFIFKFIFLSPNVG